MNVVGFANLLTESFQDRMALMALEANSVAQRCFVSDSTRPQPGFSRRWLRACWPQLLQLRTGNGREVTRRRSSSILYSMEDDLHTVCSQWCDQVGSRNFDCMTFRDLREFWRFLREVDTFLREFCGQFLTFLNVNKTTCHGNLVFHTGWTD